MFRLSAQPISSLPIEVIPVLDLKQGRAVQAIGGRRDEYRPIESRLTREGCPFALAKSYVELGFASLYLADLDAIAGAAPNRQVYAELVALGLELWIDAGVHDGASVTALAQSMVQARPLRVIAGLESLPNLDTLKGMVDQIGEARLIFSLDLLHGRPLGPVAGAVAMEADVSDGTRAEPVAHESNWTTQAHLLQALAIVEQAVASSVRQIIVLDLAHVGSEAGAGNLDLLREIHRRWTDVRLISGGGVRSRADLELLAQAGCSAALVGTALHDGSLWQGI